ncbi:MAG: efflux RND transporter periplasmic adaptor subunit [Candidatus Eisenbacteria bacterium]|jgi:cobalt-zinc-cadmium efflux system membrane fusion protein|nr:efflux RND transporter periplasmic adaptor subunit [Candidatus Eisenbacteria bacterium]
MQNLLVRIGLAVLLAAGLGAAGCSKPDATKSASKAGEAVAKDEHGEEAHEEPGHDEAGHEEPGHDEPGHTEGEPAKERIEFSKEAREASGIQVELSSAHQIQVELALPGEIAPDADRLAHIVPRFPGIAREVRKRLGDSVRQGEVLALIEGNQSLSTYEVKSLIAGTVIEKHVTLGEFVRDDADIYVVADLSKVWVNISVYARDVHRIRRGQKVRVAAVEGGGSATGTIDYLGASVGDETRAASARVVLANGNRRWMPGAYVTAHVVTESVLAPVAVPDAALQQVDGRACVFVEDGDGFVARTVTTGRTDGKWTEILSGLKPAERIVVRGSFVLKSELLKSEAGHDH